MKPKSPLLSVLGKVSEAITFLRAFMAFVAGKASELAGGFLVHLAEVMSTKLLGLIGALKELMDIPILGKAVALCIENLETLLPVLAKVAAFGTLLATCGKVLAIIGPILLAIRLGKIGVRTLESWGIDVRGAFSRAVSGIKNRIASAFSWLKSKAQQVFAGINSAAQALLEEVRLAWNTSNGKMVDVPIGLAA